MESSVPFTINNLDLARSWHWNGKLWFGIWILQVLVCIRLEYLTTLPLYYVITPAWLFLLGLIADLTWSLRYPLFCFIFVVNCRLLGETNCTKIKLYQGPFIRKTPSTVCALVVKLLIQLSPFCSSGWKYEKIYSGSWLQWAYFFASKSFTALLKRYNEQPLKRAVSFASLLVVSGTQCIIFKKEISHSRLHMNH